MSNSLKKQSLALMAAIGCLATCSTESKVATTKPTTDFDQAVFEGMRTFAETIQKAQSKHPRITDAEGCMKKAIDAFLTGLDPHSTFLDQKTYTRMMESTSGQFFGIGIVIDATRSSKDKFLLVINTIPDGPADKAEMKPLDKIVEINGESLEGMSTEEATEKLKGERNTTVTIKVLRDKEKDLLSFTIARDVVKEQSSLSFYLKNLNICYLALTTFTNTSVKQITTLLKKATEQQYKGLILDLRNNSGGLLDAAVDIAGLFVNKGSLITTSKGKDNKKVTPYSTSNEPVANTSLPIFILINNYTASAGEILAGCLKVHSEKMAEQAKNGEQKKLMVFLVGTQTFGKGSVQEIIPMSNNCAIKVTTSLYYLPNDVTIQGVGIEPDFIIEKQTPPTDQIKWFNKNYGRESALPGYIKTAEQEAADKKKDEEKKAADKKDENKKKNWSERAQELLEQDNQFRASISLINILNTARECCPDKVKNRNDAVKFLKANYMTDEKLVMEEIKI